MSEVRGNERRAPARFATAVVLLLLAAACSTGSTDRAEADLSSSAVDEAGTGAGDRADDPGADGDAERPGLDLAAGPLVFFGAVPPMPAGADLPLPDGSVDYFELFATESRWPTARGRIDAFKIHAWQLRHFIDDAELRAIIEWLDANRIPLMFETEPLPPPDPAECDHTESFEGPYDLEMAQRIADLGGTIDVVAVEEPFHFAHLLEGPGACRYPVERVVDEVIDYVDQMRSIFPGVPVGSIEPIWQRPATGPDDLALWLDTYEERAGEPFAFLHVDPDWSRPDWAETARDIEDMADGRGVPFGVLYNGGGETDGAAWLAATMDRVSRYEVEIGGTPDHVAFQSWFDQPDRVLPEDDLAAFTSIVNRWFGTRTDLDVPADGDPAGPTVELTDGAGDPLAGQDVEVVLRPLSGAAQTHAVTGTVPEGADTAVVAIRVHVEDAANGDTDVRLGRVRYGDGDADTNRVTNPDFAAGLAGWGAYGSPLGTVTVEGSPAQLRLRADETEIIMIDSDPFPVTPGSPYRFEADLGVPEASIGTATVAVVFLGASEVARHSIPFEPFPEELPAVRTDPAGRAVLPTSTLSPGRYRLDARYAGDLDHWPATAATTIEVPDP